MVSESLAVFFSDLPHLFCGGQGGSLRQSLLNMMCFAVWCLIYGASVAVPDIAVRCAEEVLLPCKVLRDSFVTYQSASWYKVRQKPKLLEQPALPSYLILGCLAKMGYFMKRHPSVSAAEIRQQWKLLSWSQRAGVFRVIVDRLFERDPWLAPGLIFYLNITGFQRSEFRWFPTDNLPNNTPKRSLSRIFLQSKK